MCKELYGLFAIQRPGFVTIDDAKQLVVVCNLLLGGWLPQGFMVHISGSTLAAFDRMCEVRGSVLKFCCGSGEI